MAPTPRFPNHPCRTFSVAVLLRLSSLLLCLISPSYSQPAQQTPSIDPDHYAPANNPCYNEMGLPQRCVPDFINAAFNLQVEVTNTCGKNGITSFCVQSGHSGVRKVCDICDSRVPGYAHPAIYLTDFNNANNETWWQSDTMNEGLQYPNSVNLTLRLGKTFDITYVRLKFISPRPESFVMYKKTRDGDEWTPWQYYSGSCLSTYKLPDKAPILPGNEDVAQCTRDFSDISPLSGGNIAFSTLDGRPSSHIFEESEVLQEWVTASEIMVSLNRMNTFGDEIFRDPKVLKTYYYAISDFAVGGRCKCNGHASECVKSTGSGEDRLVCRCEHNTQGPDCDECAPFYNERPWRPGTANEANECIACNCNHLSSRCLFDKELYEKTGSGGRCLGCQGNTQGPHCEECKADHWRKSGENFCIPCQCNEVGSLNTQCDSTGQCTCKPGVGGRHCDQCKGGFYDFTSTGCRDCQCQVAGSVTNEPFCNHRTGDCSCKQNVEGRQCDRCKPGYFDLSMDNQFGCTPCFCFGHSSICNSAEGYYAANISSDFEEGKNKWTAWSYRGPQDTQWAEMDKAAAVSDSDGASPVYFVAPEQFTGDQRSSYNQDLCFSFRLHQGQPGLVQPSARDVVFIGNVGQELALPITAQNNPTPTDQEQQYCYRIHANPVFQWNPRLNELDFIGALSNVSTMKIRGTFGRGDVGYLSNVHLGSASLAASGENPREAKWVESCNCLEGNIGQFCESCAAGYRRELKNGGPFNRCVKCDCHNHSSSCDVESGACICQHNTSGDTCERCARGYYGNALQGTEEDCSKCPCPEDGPCIIHTDNEIICTECPTGYTGRRCDICADGYFGDPMENKPCMECNCSGNTDPNRIGNCDSVTGECQKCVYNTIGFNCEKCQKGYWGNALQEPKGDCKACGCYPPGTKRVDVDYNVLECRQSDGQCECQPHVIGLQCNECQPGYFNLTSGTGCQECGCDSLGSEDGTCDLVSGQCKCKKGVTGRRCDACQALHFGFSDGGCDFCDCERIGSPSQQCDVKTGRCVCNDFVVGRRCDKCEENHYNLQAGCLECEECYTLIQRRVNEHRKNITALEATLKEIVENPAPVNDTIFDEKVKEVEKEVQNLAELVNKKLAGDDSQLVGQVNRLKEDLSEALKSIGSIDNITELAKKKIDETHEVFARWDRIRKRAEEDVEKAFNYLKTEGDKHWKLAQEAAEKYSEKSQALSTIAQEARKLADAQELRSSETAQLAASARNVSKQALTEANEAIWGGETISKQIGAMRTNLNKTGNLLNQTKKFAEEQLSEASAAYDLAAKSVTAVESLRLPEVKPDEAGEEIKRIEEDMKTAVKNAEEQAETNKAVVEEAERTVAEAKNELQRAEDQQKASDEMLADVDAALARAREAVTSSNTTVTDAETTLSTLKGFHDLVEQSKAEAVEELGKLGEIEKQIESAEETTREAESAIGNATVDANTAAALAMDAEKEANDVSGKAHILRNKTAETRSTATAMKSEAEQLANDIKQTSSSLGAYREQAEKDNQRALEAQTKAARAKMSVNATQKSINETKEKVMDIIKTLESLDVSSDVDLDTLDKNLSSAEQESTEADLSTQIKNLEEQKEQQALEMNRLTKDLSEAEKEMKNLEEIKSAIPALCYNVVAIEQEGQK